MLREILVDTVVGVVRIVAIIGCAALLREFDPTMSKEMALILVLMVGVAGGWFERRLP